jgi:GcrA cell cycle regulator
MPQSERARYCLACRCRLPVRDAARRYCSAKCEAAGPPPVATPERREPKPRPRQPALAERVCLTCPRTFVPRHPVMRYCCSGCQLAAVGERRRAARAAMQPARTWTADRLAQLERLVGDGMTFKAIGAALGVTKNEAIGAAYRRGYERREDAVLNDAQIGQRRKWQPKPLTPERFLFPPAGHCVFPLGDPGEPGFHFCAAVIEEEVAGPYCDEHHRRCYQRATPVREAA